jgi:hypothetical protein
MPKDADWICETTCIATKTLLVKATTRKEAMQKLKDGEAEGIDVDYGGIRARRVICRDGRVRRKTTIRPTSS